MDGRLVAIDVHPVKSCRRVALDVVVVTEAGLAGDRRWQVVDDEGGPLTQRTHPQLAVVEATVTADGGLTLTAPGREALDVAAPGTGDLTVRSKPGLEVTVADAGDAAAVWFAALLGEPTRLVGLTERSDLRLPAELGLWDQPIGLVDAAPVVVASAASHRWLAERAAEPFGIERFRSNLVVEVDEPWVEDTWYRFTIGGAELVGHLPWPRCAIPQVDQDTGTRCTEPARVLRSHRWCADAAGAPAAARPLLEGNALFGLACAIGPVGAILRVGDPVTVLETSPPLLPPPH